MKDNNTTANFARIRPSARIISTIGEDLVGDAYSAIVELVKNAYDADATLVEITFYYHRQNNSETLKIEISDNGHGMSTDTVLQKWLVPATADKLERKRSPGGRLFQGRKGIGRYAAAILGQELLMKTTDNIGKETEVLIDWSQFKTELYLEDVEIIVTERQSDENPGTLLSISALGEKISWWNRSELEKLSKELRKLKPPSSYYSADGFEIKLAFFDSPYEELNNQIFEIEAYPIIDMFDYGISGNVSEKGEVSAKFQNHSETNIPDEIFNFKIKLDGNAAYCGPVQFDFRVFDRENDALTNLAGKGLIDPISGNALRLNETKRLLNEVYGINLYREGFRISPYGNGGIDWLDLDAKRIQNPSLRLSNNQVVGFVTIKPEEVSHLEEKSARDGLKETAYYFGLKGILGAILNELEERRFNYRRKTGKGRKQKSVTSELNELFDYETLVSEVKTRLNFIKVDQSTVNDIAAIVLKDAEKRSKLLEDIQNTIAIYQGQATLGKIITVLLHEGRKPVGYFRAQAPNLVRYIRHYKSKRVWEDDLYEDIVSRLDNFKQQSDFLSDLFRRLDPLAKQNKGERIVFNIERALNKAVAIFAGLMEENSISCQIDCDNELTMKGWEEDFIIAITNLLENSIYWLSQSDGGEKQINLVVTADEKNITIHFRDNGPGISRETIESGSIFEPGFSKKPGGTGLGLPIAGEAIERLNGKIAAYYSDHGAYFIIELNSETQ